MSIFNAKIFLPLCAAGIFMGYMMAEHVMPKYFHPTPETKLTITDIYQAIGEQPHYFRQTLSGNYLSGQFAQRHKDWNMAHEFIERVGNRDRTNTDIQKHNMVLSMASGEVEQAVELSRKVLETTPDDILAIMFSSLGYFKNENYDKVKQQLNNAQDNNVASFISPVLKLWANTPQETLSTEELQPNSFYSYQVLLAGKYTKQNKKALKFALDSFRLDEIDLRDLEKYADLFALYGENQKALELYKIVDENWSTDEKLKNKITALENNQPITTLIKTLEVNSPKDGAALVFLDMAEILMREKSDDSATIFAQMALHLNPNLHSAYSIIANVYKHNKRSTDAITTLKKIPQSSELYIPSQRQIAEIYAQNDKHEEAIKVLKQLHATKENIEALIQIGDIHRYKEDYNTAINQYNKVFELIGEPTQEYWHILYARGMSYERIKEFKKAENDLEKALKFKPDNPYLLNYLGYSWVDQGINLDRSLEMIKKAVLALPRDGYITDSLGWAHYKMGNYEEAVPVLELSLIHI